MVQRSNLTIIAPWFKSKVPSQLFLPLDRLKKEEELQIVAPRNLTGMLQLGKFETGSHHGSMLSVGVVDACLESLLLTSCEFDKQKCCDKKCIKLRISMFDPR